MKARRPIAHRFLACLLAMSAHALGAAGLNEPRTPESASTPAALSPERQVQFLGGVRPQDIGILFLGDSITEAWPTTGNASWQKFAAHRPLNWGISGASTEQILWLVRRGGLEGIRPKVVVILIGTNNLNLPGEQPEWVAAGIGRIVDEVHRKLPKAKVLLLGLFPRGSKQSPEYHAVRKVNKIIARFDNGKSTRYLDLREKFVHSKGKLRKGVLRDGLHLSPKGYEIWYEDMKPLLGEMLK